MSMFWEVLRRGWFLSTLHQLLDLVVVRGPLWDYTNSCIQFGLLRHWVVTLEGGSEKYVQCIT